VQRASGLSTYQAQTTLTWGGALDI